MSARVYAPRNAAWPYYPRTPRTQRTYGTNTAMTPRRLEFIKTLIAERADIYRALGEDSAADAILAHEVDPATISDPSAAIDRMKATNKQLKEQLKATRTKSTGGKVDASLTPGMYHLDGKNYRVRESKSSGRLYAEEAVSEKLEGEEKGRTEFVYARGVIYSLTSAHRMTPEQAKAHGAYFGTCVCCGRHLENTVSVDRMVGPVCWEKYFA